MKTDQTINVKITLIKKENPPPKPKPEAKK